MNLFQKRYIELHSGEVSDFKVECDALTDEDLECLAYLVSKKIKFCGVHGIPTGGLRFASKLEQYADLTSDTYLLVDDVLTSDRSMEEEKRQFTEPEWVRGVAIFSRAKETPLWITPIFQMML